MTPIGPRVTQNLPCSTQEEVHWSIEFLTFEAQFAQKDQGGRGLGNDLFI